MKAIVIIIMALVMHAATAEVIQKNATVCLTKDDLKAIDTLESFRVMIASGRCLIIPADGNVSMIDYGILASKIRIFGKNMFIDVYTNTSNIK